MKRLKTYFFLILVILVFTSGCGSRRFAYEYEDLRNNLIAAELIYLHDELCVFLIHWPEKIEEFEYTLVRTFSEDEFSDLIRSISRLSFSYTVYYLPISISAIYHIEGYVIALYYADDSRILIGQNAEHRHNTEYWIGQNQTGRYNHDRVWNNFIRPLLP